MRPYLQRNLSDPLLERVARRCIDCPDTDFCLERVARRTDMALLTTSDSATYRSEAGGYQQLIQPLPSGILWSAPVTMYIQKDSLLKDHLDMLIGWFQQAGMLQQWLKEIGREARMKNIVNTQSVEISPTSISLTHLQGAFLLLITGLGTASIFFFAEQMSILCSTLLPPRWSFSRF